MALAKGGARRCHEGSAGTLGYDGYGEIGQYPLRGLAGVSGLGEPVEPLRRRSTLHRLYGFGGYPAARAWI